MIVLAFDQPRATLITSGVCSFPECGATKHHAKGLCFTHYYRQYRHGDLNLRRPANFTGYDLIVNMLAEGDRSQCWTWPHGNAKGRGLAVDRRTGKRRYVPRIAWELDNGATIPAGMFACHACDDPRCYNPDHIFIGTQKDNMQDALAKGRMVPPPVTAKLTPRQVEAIRSDHRIARLVAADYGVSLSAVYAIRKGLTWRLP